MKLIKINNLNYEQILKKIYYDPKHPAGFGSLQQLYKELKKLGYKTTLKNIKKWLSTQETHTLHKRIVKNFQRRKTISKGIDFQWQADLIIMDPIKKENRNFKYILTIIDVFSRFAWAIPLKNKTGKEITIAFNKIFKESKRHPVKLQTDKGTEFLNKTFQDFLKEKKIFHFSTDQEPKAALVERFNRTLKIRMFKYFTSAQTLNYVKILPDLMNSYNNRKHRIIGIAPINVVKKNESDIFEKQYSKYLSKKRKKFKFNYNDPVRITQFKGVFKKGYEQSWTKEHFFIADRLNTNPPTYKLIDKDNEILTGAFYEEELVKITL